MKKLRLGIIGLGAMGNPHVGFALTLSEVDLTALCDRDPARIEKVKEAHYSRGGSPFPTVFSDASALLSSRLVDAVLIATPHYDHQPIAIEAFSRGIHVLCEKPLTVTVQGARAMIDAWTQAKKRHPDLQFAAMLMQRTWGHWKKVKDLIAEGELGRIVRATWIVTDWFRTAQYYRSGGWRATWAGEGGGVLTNQSPHNLDLLQWFLGMPDRVTAFGGLGKYHDIAVEDEVSAVLHYDHGAVAHFITSTAESPGTNRLEIVGENGKLVYENQVLTFHRNRQSMRTWSESTTQLFQGPECWAFPVPFTHHGESGHRLVVQNFARAILFQEPLVAPGAEGLHQVTLTNAMMVSLLGQGRTIDLAQAEEFEGLLAELKAKEAARTR